MRTKAEYTGKAAPSLAAKLMGVGYTGTGGFMNRFRPTTLALCFSLLCSFQAVADDPPPTPEDLERMAAIEAFTKRQIEANYGEKFKQAAEEFNVPVEILMGVSFAQTRHEHLVWPDGETVSPHNGMPRPYGIMSLWDNEFFGHSLIEGAKLIGKTPEELKKDPLQNMRGAAALLRKIYDENEKPNYAKENSLESWKYAIVKYSGIPEPDLSHQHAFDVYDFLRQGYDDYGIKLPFVPELELDEMWAETKRIKEEERKKNEEKWRAEGLMDDTPVEEIQGADGMWHAVSATNQEAIAALRNPKAKSTPEPVVAANTTTGQSNWIIGLGILALAAVALVFLMSGKKKQGK